MHLAQTIRKYLGWCPNADMLTMRPRQPVIATLPVTLLPAQPEGGAGGSGRIDRGMKLALGSIWILFRNRRLFWFSLLTGIVTVFNLVTSLYLQFISGTLPLSGTNLLTGPAHVLIAKGSLPLIALTFTTGLIYSFIASYLLAALMTCVSLLLSGQAMTIREGLTHAGRYLRPLGIWALIGALVGTFLSIVMNSFSGNFVILFIPMGVSFVFFCITLFVIPAIVLGNDNLIPAIWGSVLLFRKTWGEIVVCLGIFFLIMFALLLTSLIPMIFIGFSSGSSALAGAVVVLYMLVMLILIFIGSTVLGIAIVGLYTYGRTGTLSAMFEGKQKRGENA